jgi:hypothetical protein
LTTPARGLCVEMHANGDEEFHATSMLIAKGT